MKRLYIIAGCNGAGKTTASYTVLPEMLNCKEFVNADEIAKGLSPFNVDAVAVEAGRLMLNRIAMLLEKGETFSIETTLATRSYLNLVKKAQSLGYSVMLLFFWIDSPSLAKNRVAKRVREGGHDIPPDVISRRYHKGLKNLFEIFMPIVDDWLLYDNNNTLAQLVAMGGKNKENIVENKVTYEKITSIWKRMR